VTPSSLRFANIFCSRAVKLSSMLCPSAPFNRLPLNGTKGSRTAALGDNWARGNYGGNGALGFMTTGEANSAGGLTTPWWQYPLTRGITGPLRTRPPCGRRRPWSRALHRRAT
jgi:hypothetical protein